MTKIDIVSGFLGAGKTTLIKKLLKEALAGTQTVLIENEFGEIGIDGGFLKDAGIEIKEMNSGCICCSLVGDFGTSLKEVLNTYHPDRILIEPSGVGKLSDVMKAVQNAGLGTEVELNSAVAVVDASKCKMYIKNFGEFFINQIEHAGTIILSRTDVASEEKVKQAVELIREHNEKATIITTPLAQLEGKEILAVIEGAKDLEAELMEQVKAMHDEHEHHIMMRRKTNTSIAAIITMMRKKTNMSIIMSTTKTAPAAVTIMSTTITIMPMKSSPAGALKLLQPTRQKRLRAS